MNVLSDEFYNKFFIFTVNFSMIDNLLGNLYSTFNELKTNFGNDFTHFVNKLTKIGNS
jgi:hypothetical protein